MNLRVHHLLCAPLYVGKGYSEKFTENMDTVVARLKEGTRLRLQVTPDVVCSECPNQDKERRVCTLDCDKVKNKDEALLDVLSLCKNEEYDSSELMRYIRETMTREMFENSCSRCDWYLQGLCSYDKYIEGLNKFI